MCGGGGGSGTKAHGSERSCSAENCPREGHYGTLHLVGSWECGKCNATRGDNPDFLPCARVVAELDENGKKMIKKSDQSDCFILRSLSPRSGRERRKFKSGQADQPSFRSTLPHSFNQKLIDNVFRNVQSSDSGHSRSSLVCSHTNYQDNAFKHD